MPASLKPYFYEIKTFYDIFFFHSFFFQFAVCFILQMRYPLERVFILIIRLSVDALDFDGQAARDVACFNCFRPSQRNVNISTNFNL